MNNQEIADSPGVIATGVEGLDDVLRGGLVADRLYLVEGLPGSGKTTLALQFLFAGIKHGERCMLVTLSETKDELRASAVSHGWSLEGIDILEIVGSEYNVGAENRYTMYHPSEVELGETTKMVLAEATQRNPARLVVDSLSEFRLLAGDSLRYRRSQAVLCPSARNGTLHRRPHQRPKGYAPPQHCARRYQLGAGDARIRRGPKAIAYFKTARTRVPRGLP